MKIIRILKTQNNFKRLFSAQEYYILNKFTLRIIDLHIRSIKDLDHLFLPCLVTSKEKSNKESCYIFF